MMNSAQPILFILVFAGSLHAQSTKHLVSGKQATEIVAKVLKQSPVIDGHNDLLVHYFDCKTCPKDLQDYRIDTTNTGHTDIPRLRKGGVGGVLLNIFGKEKTLESYLQGWDLVFRMEEQYPNDLKIVKSAAEMKTAFKAGKIALLPSLEGASRLGDNLYLLRTYYALGLRSVTFAYKTNQLADGSDDAPKYNGISPFGKEMVKEMNRLGVLIDMSHISTKAMGDILDVTQSPVIFSHSNARALCDVNRNVSDDVLKQLKENKGLIMLTPVPYFITPAYKEWLNQTDSVYAQLYSGFEKNPADSLELDKIGIQWEKEHPSPVVTIQDMADHFDYVKNLIGVDHIGIAGDYDGMDLLVKGMEDISSYPKLLVELAMRGWTEIELRKITGENFLRVFEEVEQKAKALKQVKAK